MMRYQGCCTLVNTESSRKGRNNHFFWSPPKLGIPGVSLASAKDKPQRNIKRQAIQGVIPLQKFLLGLPNKHHQKLMKTAGIPGVKSSVGSPRLRILEMPQREVPGGCLRAAEAEEFLVVCGGKMGGFPVSLSFLFLKNIGIFLCFFSFFFGKKVKNKKHIRCKES